MGERLSPVVPTARARLAQLGSHVSGSLEGAIGASDAAARVRARLASGEARRAPNTRMRVRPGAALGALAVAAAVLAVFFGWRSTRAHADRALTFTISAPDGNGAKGEPGVVGAFLAAPPSGELPIAFSDGTSVHIGAGARARIAEVTPRGARVLVESGIVRANVVHRTNTHWLVDAGPFEVKVTGTRFDVAWQPNEQAVVVTLHEGSVVVTGCGLANGQRVLAGQQLRASCTSNAPTIGPISEAEAPLPAVPPLVATTSATALPDAPMPVEAPAAATTAARTASATAAAHASSTPAPVPIAPPPSAPASASPAAVSAAELLSRATADRYAGRLDEATEALDTVRRRFAGSDAAATAAFELGRIAFDGRHDFVRAADWFDTYLRERPSGTLAREALGRALEARQRSGDSRRASDLATRYLSTYPDGPHATLARRLAGRHEAEDTP